MSAAHDAAFTRARGRLTNLFEDALSRAADTWRWPAPLGDACRHGLFGGGKRVRPLLALMGAEAVGGDASTALAWAVAVEMVHTYSLLHDDLPAMDDDDTRRGKPTCHVVYGEAMAVLAGDTLLTEAFAVLASADWSAPVRVELTGRLAGAAGGAGMVGGQVLDVGDHFADLDALVHMQRLKTGALIQGALVGGALAAGGSPAQLATLEAAGAAIGLLFQITDDLLDAEQDAERSGCSFLHHMDLAAVLERKDQVTAKAADALLDQLGDAADALVGLTHYIAARSV